MSVNKWVTLPPKQLKGYIYRHSTVFFLSPPNSFSWSCVKLTDPGHSTSCNPWCQPLLATVILGPQFSYKVSRCVFCSVCTVEDGEKNQSRKHKICVEQSLALSRRQHSFVKTHMYCIVLADRPYGSWKRSAWKHSPPFFMWTVYPHTFQNDVAIAPPLDLLPLTSESRDVS